MQELKLTAKDFHNGKYIGKTSLVDYDGDVTIATGLGWVYFDHINIMGDLFAGLGTSIEAGDGIKAGEGIKVGDGIKAGEGIEAGWGIKAGEGIEAGGGIISGLSITCKLTLSFKYRLFAGVATWRNTNNEDKKITCGKLEGGTVCYGDVVETGLPDEPTDTTPKEIEINGAKYRLVE